MVEHKYGWVLLWAVRNSNDHVDSSCGGRERDLPRPAAMMICLRFRVSGGDGVEVGSRDHAQNNEWLRTTKIKKEGIKDSGFRFK